MQTRDWLKAHWRHGGESLYALGCNSPLDPLLSRSRIPLPLYRFASHAEGRNRHREMVHASSKPQFSKAVRSERSPCASLTFALSFANSSETLPSFSSCRGKGHSSYFLFADVRVLSFRSVHFISFHGILNLFKLDCLCHHSFLIMR